MATNPKSVSDTAADKKVAAKWTKTLAKAGWASFPNVIFERQRTLNLSPIDINILLHLAGYRWNPGNHAHPSKKTIATALNIHPRTVQKHIEEMERWGTSSVSIGKRASATTTRTSMTSLALLRRPLRLQGKARRARTPPEEQKDSVTRKKPLAIVKGGKE